MMLLSIIRFANIFSASLLISTLLIVPAFGNVPVKQSRLIGKDSIIKVTLLGTGTPQPLMERFGPSILVQAGGKTLLFDAGRGCLQRLRQFQVSYNAIDAVFFTHLHSDHIVGLPDLWLTGWLLSNRKIPMVVFGPEGTKAMTDYLQKAYAFDIKMRTEDDKAPASGGVLSTTDIKEGVIYDNSGVKVTAFLVDHYPIVPAFGYKIEYGGRSVVLSGDTRFSKNLIKFAKGTDLLVHEVAVAPDTLTASDPLYHILAHHTTPEQASEVFNEVRPRLAVFSHIVILYGRTMEELLNRTKVKYSGPLVLGEDLMCISIGEQITVKPWEEREKHIDGKSQK